MKNFFEKIETIELELTNTCNLQCKLCSRTVYYNKDDFKIKKIMNLEKLKETLKLFPNLKYISIAGEYSEPTLYPYLFDLVKYLHQNNYTIFLNTNSETHNLLYYKKLMYLFKNTNSKIYTNISGTTEELHSKYRVGSTLKRVLKISKELNKISKKNLIVTWIIFEYNYKNFQENKNFLKNYNSEIFYTLPVAEHYNLKNSINDQICLPKKIQEKYNTIDKKNFDKKFICTAKKYNFLYIDVDLNFYPCSLAKHNNKTIKDILNSSELFDFCFECSPKNFNTLNENSIKHLAECESEDSEDFTRL